MLLPLKPILQDYDIEINIKNNRISALQGHKIFELIVQPSMKNKPQENNKILVSDFDVKYSRAYAVDFIRNSFKNS